MTADRSRWIALYVLCMGMLMIVLDRTVSLNPRVAGRRSDRSP